jgi:hypothetical protein
MFLLFQLPGQHPLVLRLLYPQDLARREPDHPAQEVLETDPLAVVAGQTGQEPPLMTTGAF